MPDKEWPDKDTHSQKQWIQTSSHPKYKNAANQIKERLNTRSIIALCKREARRC